MNEFEYGILVLGKNADGQNEALAHNFITAAGKRELLETSIGRIGVLNLLGKEGWLLNSKERNVMYFSRPPISPDPPPSPTFYYVIFRKSGHSFTFDRFFKGPKEKADEMREKYYSSIERGHSSITMLSSISEPYSKLEDAVRFVDRSSTTTSEYNANMARITTDPLFIHEKGEIR